MQITLLKFLYFSFFLDCYPSRLVSGSSSVGVPAIKMKLNKLIREQRGPIPPLSGIEPISTEFKKRLHTNMTLNSLVLSCVLYGGLSGYEKTLTIESSPFCKYHDFYCDLLLRHMNSRTNIKFSCGSFHILREGPC